MAEALEKEEQKPEEQEFVKSDPKLNPRNQSLAEIAKNVAAQHEAEVAENANIHVTDDEGNVANASAEQPAEEPTEEVEPAAAEEPAAEPAPAVATVAAFEPEGVDVIEPDALYEVKVDGQPLQVPGQKLIDAGIRTFQKETAADYRLKQASELLQEAERRLAAASTPQGTTQPQQPAQKQNEPTDADLAQAIQFGTPEQASSAIAILKSRNAITPDEVSRLVDARSRVAARDELQFNEALNFVKAEYGDLLANDYLKKLFFVEENQRRASGDKRPYKELYQEIGDNLRKAFNQPKPASAQTSSQPSTPGTTQARAARKAAAPSVPRTAASRLEQADAQAKVKSTSEIIAAMQASRGKDRLMPQRKQG